MTRRPIRWRGWLRLTAVYVGAFVIIWAVRWVPLNWDINQKCHAPQTDWAAVYSDLVGHRASAPHLPHVPTPAEASQCITAGVFNRATQSTILWFFGIPVGLVGLIAGYRVLLILRTAASAILAWVVRGYRSE
jgi:hypothetical protein